MEKIEDENYEDGELTSDSENENLAINDQNNDFKNLLTDFESHMKKSNLNENRSQKIRNDKKAHKLSDNGKSLFVEEEDDELIFVRGASPPIQFHDENFVNKNKELPFKNLELISQSSYNKYKNRKSRKTNSELYSSSIFTSFTQQLKICKFYLYDKCGKTEKTCTFLHSQFPCKYYYLGINCPDGDKCKLSHGGVLSDEMKEALLLHIQIAPREILGDFKMSADHAKKLLNNRHTELASKNVEMKQITSSETFVEKTNNCKEVVATENVQNVLRSESTQKKPKKNEYLSIPDFLKIEKFNDILNEKQIKSLKKIGVSYSYQLLTLSMIELNACGINVMEVIKIQERIKEKDKINSLQITSKSEEKKDVDMRNFPISISPASVDDSNEVTLLPSAICVENLNNSKIDDIDEEEECNLIIDEEASNMSEGELELLKRDLQNKINQTQEDVVDLSKGINSNESFSNFNYDMIKNNKNEVSDENKNNLFLTDKDDIIAIDLSNKTIDNQNIKQNILISNEKEYLESTLNSNEINNESVFSNQSEKIKKIELNDYAKDLRKISTNINTIDDIKIITPGDFDMRLPFNPILQDYKPATECDGSFTSHPFIPWKLVEMLIPIKEPISLELIEKLQKANDPRCRKQSIHKEQYSFDGNIHCLLDETSKLNSNNLSVINSTNENNNKMVNNVDFIDPRKNQTKSSTYENINSNQVPSVMQILQHYLHRSIWYNEQNSKTKMEINELVAELANHLKKFKLQNTPNKKFNLCELKYFNKIQNVLSNLKIFIDSNGSILPEKQPEINFFDNTGVVTNNFIGGFETFWGGMQPSQQQLPVISNLVPIGSFQAPAPLNFAKPGLLGMHPNDVGGIDFNNPFRPNATTINNNNMHFGNNIFYGNQNFALRFEGNYKPLFQQEPSNNMPNRNFRMLPRGNMRSNDRNLTKNRNNFKIRNNNNFGNRYNNVRNKKPTNNNNHNNFGFYDKANSTEDNNNNNNKDCSKCSPNEDNWDEITNTELIKNNNENSILDEEKSLKNNKSDEEDWDCDTDDKQLEGREIERSCDNQNLNKNENNVSLKSLKINNEENWDSDDKNDNLLTAEYNNSIRDSSKYKKSSVERESLDIVPEKKIKLSNDYDNSCEQSTELSLNFNDENFSYVKSDEKSLNNSKKSDSFFYDTKLVTTDEEKNLNKYFVNNIEISKSVTVDDSEEEWD